MASVRVRALRRRGGGRAIRCGVGDIVRRGKAFAHCCSTHVVQLSKQDTCNALASETFKENNGRWEKVSLHTTSSRHPPRARCSSRSGKGALGAVIGRALVRPNHPKLPDETCEGDANAPCSPSPCSSSSPSFVAAQTWHRLRMGSIHLRRIARERNPTSEAVSLNQDHARLRCAGRPNGRRRKGAESKLLVLPDQRAMLLSNVLSAPPLCMMMRH